MLEHGVVFKSTVQDICTIGTSIVYSALFSYILAGFLALTSTSIGYMYVLMILDGGGLMAKRVNGSFWSILVIVLET